MSAHAPGTRPNSRPHDAGESLRIVDTPQRSNAPRAPFVIVVLVLLLGGLGGLLMLNTLLAQGSFAVHDLDQKVAALRDKEQALQQRVATLAAPQRLARHAAAIGMVPAENPAFFRMSDGRILGHPTTATGTPLTSPTATDPIESRVASVDPKQSDEAATANEPGSDEKQKSTKADGNTGESHGDKSRGDKSQGENSHGEASGGANGGANGGERDKNN